MNITTIAGADGYRIELQPFERNNEKGWLGVVVFGPQGGLRASVDLPPDEVAKLRRGRDYTGAEITEGAGPDESCGCGEPITWFQGEWLHIYNDTLRGTDDHTPEPGEGYYAPEEDDGELEDAAAKDEDPADDPFLQAKET